MMSKIGKVFKKVLNDKDLFDSPYDREARAPIPKLFEGASWEELKRLFNENKKDEFVERTDNRIREIENQERNASGWRRDRLDELKKRAQWLKSAFDNKPHLLKTLFENLKWYGLVECKLPKMEDYGKVIERYDISIVEHYFVNKIKKAPFPQNRALEKILEYIKELYKAGISYEEIAYFVRKIDLLTKYWEVIE